MCWSLPASATFGIIAAATGIWRWRAGDIPGKSRFFLYFAAMEALQCASYLVINDCESRANQILTALAWLHIAWQPLVVNQYFLGLEGDIHRDVSALIRGLCVVAGLGLSARLAVPGNPVMALGSYLNRNALPVPAPPSGGSGSPSPPLSFVPFGPNHPGFAFPELPPAASASGGAHCGFEAICGARLCTFQGVRHLAWSVPLLPSTYLLPSGFVHTLLFFGPAIFAPGAKIVVRRVLAIGAFAIGPLLSMAFSANNATRDVINSGKGEGSSLGVGDKMAQLFPDSLGFAAGNGYANTWPAWWCFMSAAQALLILVGDFLARDAGDGLTEREKVAKVAQSRAAAEAAAAAAAAAAKAAAKAAAGGKGGAPPPSSTNKQTKNLTVLASVEHEYHVTPPVAAAPRGGGGTSRRRAAAK